MSLGVGTCRHGLAASLATDGGWYHDTGRVFWPRCDAPPEEAV